jgi:hypothetical protein
VRGLVGHPSNLSSIIITEILWVMEAVALAGVEDSYKDRSELPWSTDRALA